MRSVASGIVQLTGFLPNAINVFLAGDVLIDAGTKFSGPLMDRDLAGRDVSLVALTHVHPDHQGRAKALRDRGIPLACHHADADRQEHGPVQTDEGFVPGLSDRAFTGPLCPVDQRLEHGDIVGDGLRVVHLPGHTDGHVAFFRESDRVVLCGDVVNTMHLLTMWPGVREPPEFFSVDPELNRQSIRKLAELRPSLLLAGHGPPTRGEDLDDLVAKLDA